MSNIVVEVLFNLADVSRFYEQLDNLIAANEINATVGSLTMRGEIRFGISKKNIFASNPTNYCVSRNLSEYIDFESFVFVHPVEDFLERSKPSFRSPSFDERSANGWKLFFNR